MKEDEFNAAVIDAVHSLEKTDQRVYVFTKNTQAVWLAKIITATMLLATFALFSLFFIIMYS